MIEIRGLDQALRRPRGAARRRPDRRPLGSGLPDRAERIGQEHAAALRQLSRILRCRRSAHRGQADRLRGWRRTGRAGRWARGALREMRREIGMVFQHFNLWPHMSALRNVAEPLRRVRGLGATRGRGARAGDAEARRPFRQGRGVPVAPVGRPAAARRHRARAGDAAAADAVRRADLGARSRTGRRSAGGDEEPRERGHDDADRHPRNGLRRPRRRPHRLHRRRPHRRTGPAALRVPRKRGAAGAAVLADVSRPE